jgi:hypothetical protein
MSIDRDAAANYAKMYWNRACDDELVGIKQDHVRLTTKRKLMDAPADKGWIPYFRSDGQNGENAVFGRTVNGKLEFQDRPFLIDVVDHLNDCTHYVSRCLLREGISIKEEFGANDLITSLLTPKRKDVKVLAEKTDQKTGQKIINSGVFKPGDVVGYSNSKGHYHHSAMFIKSADRSKGFAGGITCHSNCRFSGLTQNWNGENDDDWYIGSDAGPYTLIHFCEDDSSLPVGSPYGWWKVGDRFYSISLNGTAKSTMIPPKSNNDRLHHGSANALLFAGLDGIIFIWTLPKGDVRVELWNPVFANRQSTIVRTDKGPVNATRIF